MAKTQTPRKAHVACCMQGASSMLHVVCVPHVARSMSLAALRLVRHVPSTQRVASCAESSSEQVVSRCIALAGPGTRCTRPRNRSVPAPTQLNQQPTHPPNPDRRAGVRRPLSVLLPTFHPPANAGTASRNPAVTAKPRPVRIPVLGVPITAPSRGEPDLQGGQTLFQPGKLARLSAARTARPGRAG